MVGRVSRLRQCKLPMTKVLFSVSPQLNKLYTQVMQQLSNATLESKYTLVDLKIRYVAADAFKLANAVGSLSAWSSAVLSSWWATHR